MAKAITVTPGTPSGLSRHGQPLEVWGVRVASAAAREDWTKAQIDALDDYKRHGVNTLTVFYQGSSGGHVQAFSDDGREIDSGVRERMDRLARACAEREMLLVAGIFYQRERLATRDAYVRAAEAVGKQLGGHDNVIVNVVNEHNSGGYDGAPFPLRTAEGIVELCQVVRGAAPDLLVGGGGIHPGVNAELSVRPELDLLLFDWHGTSQEAVEAYRAAGSDKPLMNVELFGGWGQGFVEEDDVPEQGVNVSWPGWGRGAPKEAPSGRRRIQGVLPEQTEGTHRGRADFLADVEYAARTPGFSLFGHFPGWWQGPSRQPTFDCRFDLGGDGTRANPGIRWYFEAVARARGIQI
ncbi:MAG TPA: hypothetical protein VFN74_08870 [Chloroflexota bacterium]|nr:hypothetical protein [Chloroflexota bacterium]